MWHPFKKEKIDVPGRHTWWEWDEKVRNVKSPITLFPEQGKIVRLFGVAGVGKSTTAARIARERLEDATKLAELGIGLGYRVAINMDLYLPPTVNPKLYIRYGNIWDVIFKERCLIIIDEGSPSGLDCREWMNNPQPLRDAISLRRHYEQGYIILSQVFDQLEKSIRDQTDDLLEVENHFWGKVTKLVRYVKVRDEVEPLVMKWQRCPLLLDWFRHDLCFINRNEIYALFDSWQDMIGFQNLSKLEKYDLYEAAYHKEKNEENRKKEFEKLYGAVPDHENYLLKIAPGPNYTYNTVHTEKTTIKIAVKDLNIKK